MPHNFKMPREYIDRMIERLGREHVQETFETEKTALVEVDMQNYFMDESQMADCERNWWYRYLDSEYGT